jgi:hypothetical protein
MEENLNIRKNNISVNDKEFEKQLRPLSFNDFKGQKQIIENLVVFVTAAKQRGESLDLPDWVKQPWPQLSQMNCRLTSALLRDRFLINLATLPDCSLIFRKEMFCL